MHMCMCGPRQSTAASGRTTRCASARGTFGFNNNNSITTTTTNNNTNNDNNHTHNSSSSNNSRNNTNDRPRGGGASVARLTLLASQGSKPELQDVQVLADCAGASATPEAAAAVYGVYGTLHISVPSRLAY